MTSLLRPAHSSAPSRYQASSGDPIGDAMAELIQFATVTLDDLDAVRLMDRAETKVHPCD